LVLGFARVRFAGEGVGDADAVDGVASVSFGDSPE